MQGSGEHSLSQGWPSARFWVLTVDETGERSPQSRNAMPHPPHRPLPLAGEGICAHVLAHPHFTAARRMAIYVDCPRLCEANSTPLVSAALEAGRRCAAVG